MKKSLVYLLIVMVPTGILFAQDQPVSKKHQFPLEFSFINQAVSNDWSSIPAGTLLDIVHPGFSLATEYAYLEGRHLRLYQGLQGGYYDNTYAAKALFLQTALGLRFTFGFGLFSDIALGFGYLHSFHPAPVWRLNDGGEYEPAANTGKGAALVSVGMSLGYDFSRTAGWPLSLFLRFQPYLQTPYNMDEGVMFQSWFQIGVRVRLW